MIQKLERILKAHAKAIEAAQQEYDTSAKFYRANFINDMYHSKVNEAKAKRDQDIYNHKDSTQKQVNEVIAELHAKVSSMVTDTNPDTLAAINSLRGMKLSAGEIQTLAVKYRENYMAMKMLSNIAAENGLILKYTSVDDLHDAITELEEFSASFIKTYTGDVKNATYKQMLVTVPEHPFAATQEFFNTSTIDVVQKPKAPLTAEQQKAALSLFAGYEDKLDDRVKELNELNLPGSELLNNYHEALCAGTDE